MANQSNEVIWVELKALRELVEAVREGDQKALKLQATEYERRLDDLNHAHKIAATRDANFVTRELHDTEFRRVDQNYSTLSRIVWIGIGIVMVAQVILYAMISHLVKP